MSLSAKGAARNGPETRTAAFHDEIAASTTEQAFHTFEATEDRLVVGIKVAAGLPGGASDGGVTGEVSWSSTSVMAGTSSEVPKSDDTSAGVIAFDNTHQNATNQYAGDAHAGTVWFQNAIHWGEGEELNIHARNASDGTARIRVIVYYVRVSDC